MNGMPTGFFFGCLFFLLAGVDSLFFTSPVPAGAICFASLNIQLTYPLYFHKYEAVSGIGFQYNVLSFIAIIISHLC